MGDLPGSPGAASNYLFFIPPFPSPHHPSIPAPYLHLCTYEPFLVEVNVLPSHTNIPLFINSAPGQLQHKPTHHPSFISPMVNSNTYHIPPLINFTQGQLQHIPHSTFHS